MRIHVPLRKVRLQLTRLTASIAQLLCSHERLLTAPIVHTTPYLPTLSHEGGTFTIATCHPEVVNVVNVSGAAPTLCQCLYHPNEGNRTVYTYPPCPAAGVCECIEVQAVFRQPRAMLWIIFCAGSVLSLFVLWLRTKPAGETACCGGKGRTPGGGGEGSPQSGAGHGGVPKAFAFAFGYIGGTCGAVSVIGLKVTVEMVSTGARHPDDNQVGHFMFWVFFVFAIGLAVLNMVALQVRGSVAAYTCVNDGQGGGR